MLHPDHVDYLARKERYKDLVHQAECERLLYAADSSRPRQQPLYRQLVGWIGLQLVKLGCQLQRFAGTSPAKTAIAFHQVLSGSEYNKK